ncbi:GDSL-type esterase/lipase family protein [Mycoplasma sp. CSL10166]|uniref:GDSL-type esterase/lipase family protein n=1 Tax=Mycoplasma sp. CSL10166 TaxID=2813825 RepID=UPI00197B5478|nr:GDSL-type esterase/lipase family protein [Mycoplasma sp. CSL10166]MBN4084441.1 hypothetical protein [Mycoplasma sp. CSL10166]
MKKNKKLIFGTAMALVLSAGVVVACKAPGSDKELQSGGKDLYEKIKEKNNISSKEPLVIEPYLPKPNEESNSQNGNKSISESTKILRKVSKNFIDKNQKIKYVAIGDSVTEGFDASTPEILKGNYQNGNIEGLSYPAYLARLLNFNGRVESFDNFAHSGSQIIDWIKFFDIEFDSTYQSNIKLGNKEEIKNKLENANLITLTLGANDLFYLLFKSATKYDITKIIKSFIDKKPIIGDSLVFFNNIFKDSIPELKKRLTTFLANLKVMAPKANINIVSYPSPFLQLDQIITDFITKSVGQNLDISPISLLTSLINDAIKSVADSNGVNYVDVFNNNYWTVNKSKLNSLFLDIHPNNYGYKKMAMDLYLKITHPTLNTEDYQNYNFDNDYLEKDAKTTNYQIEAVQSDQEVFGNSSESYLDNKNQEELENDLNRNPRNFGVKIGVLTQEFSFIAKEIIEFISNNTLYNELDPEHRLSNFLNSTNSNNQTILDNVVNNIINSQLISSIVTDLENSLAILRDKNELNLENLGHTFMEVVLNVNNIPKIISIIAKTDLTQEQRTEFGATLKYIVKNLLNRYGNDIFSALTSSFDKFLSTYNISKEQITQIINSIFKSNDFNEILNDAIDLFANHPEKFSNLENINQLILAFISDENTNTKIASKISNIFKELLKNPALNSLFSSLIFNILEKNELTTNITKSEIISVTTDLIDLINEIDTQHKIIENFVSISLNSFPSYGFDKIQELLSNSFLGAVSKISDDNNQEKSIITLINQIFKSNLVKNHKDLSKNLINNILDKSKLKNASNLMYPLISQTMIGEYISDQSFSKIVNLFFKQDSFNNLVKDTLNSLIDNSNNFETVKNYNELVVQILQNVNEDKFKKELKATLANLWNDPELAQTIKQILTDFAHVENIDSSPSVINFIQGFSSDFGNILKQTQLIESLIDVIFDQIKKAKEQNANTIEKLNELPNLISIEINKILNEKGFELFKEVIQKDYVTNNKEGVSLIVSVIVNKLTKNGTLQNLINNLLETYLVKPEISKYVEKDEISKIISKVFSSANFSLIIQDLVKIYISNSNQINNFSSITSLANALLKDATFKTLLNQDAKPLIKEIIKSGDYNKTITKVIIELSKNTKYNIDEKYKPVIKNIVPSILDTLEATNTFDSLIDNFIKLLTQSNDLNEVTNGILTTIKNSFNFSDVELYKTILKTNLFSNENGTLSLELVKSLIKTFITNDLDSTLEFALPESALGIQKTELKQFILKVAKDQNFKNIYEKSLDLIFNNSKEISNIHNFYDIFNIAVKKLEVNNIKDSFENLFKTIKKDDVFKKLISNIIDSQISNQEISWLFKNVKNKKQLLTDLSSSLITQIDKFNLITLLFDSLNEYKNQNKENINDIIEILINKLKDKFNKENISTTLFNFIKDISKDFASKNKEDIKIIFNNIYNYLKENNTYVDFILNNLPSEYKNTLNKYISDQDLKSFVNLLINNDTFKEIIINSFNKVIDSTDQLQNANDINNIISIALNSLATDSNLKQNIINFLTSATNQNEIKTIIANTISKYVQLNYPKIYDQNKTNIFISNLITDGFTIFKDLGLVENVLDSLITFTKSEGNNEFNFEQRIQTLTNNLKNNLNTLVNNHLDELISRLFKSNTINSDFNYSIQVFKFISTTLLDNIQIFKDIINDALKDAKLIDDSQKLDEEKLNEFKELLFDINNSNVNNSILDQLLNITQEQASLINNFNSLKEVLINNLTNAVKNNYFTIIKSILNSKFVQNQKEWIKKVLENALNNYLTDEKSIAFLNSINLNEISSSIGIDKDLIVSTIKEIVNNTNTKEVIKKVIEKILDNIDSIKNSTNINDLIKKVFSINGLKDEIKEETNAILSSIIQKDSIKRVLTEALKKIFEKDFIAPYLNGVNNKAELAKSVVDILDIIDEKIKLSDLSFELIYNQLQTNGINFNVTSLLNTFVSSLKNIFSGNNGETKAVDLIKALVSSSLFKNHKEDIKTIIKNLIIKFSKGTFIDDLFNNISSSTREKIENYVNINDLSNILKLILRNQHLHNIINNSITKLVNNINQFESVKSYQGLISKLFELVNFNEIKSELNLMFSDLSNEISFKDALKQLLISLLNKNGVETTDEGINSFIDYVSNNLKDFFKSSDILNNLSSEIFDKIKEVFSQNSENTIEKLTKLPNDIVELIKSKITQQPKSFVDGILNSSNIQPHKEAIIKIVKQLFIGLNKKGVIELIVNSQIDKINDPSVTKYLDLNLFKKMVGTVLKDDFINDTLNVIVPELLNDTSWLNNLNNPFKLIQEFFKKETIKNHFKNNLPGALERISKNSTTTNFINSLLNNVLKNNQITIQGSESNSFVYNIASNIVPYLKEVDLYNNIIETIINQLSSSATLKQFVESIKTNIISKFDLADYKFVKALFNNFSSIENNKEIVVEIFEKIYDKFKENDSWISTIISLVNKDQVLVNTNNEEKLKTIIKEVLKEESIKTSLTSIIRGSLTNLSIFKNANNYQDLIKSIFSNENLKTPIKDLFDKLTKKLLENENFKTIVKNILDKKLPDDIKTKLFENITTDNDKIDSIGWLLTIIKESNNNFNIFNSFIESGIKQLGTNGTIQFNVSEFISDAIENIKKFTNYKNIEAKILSVLNTLKVQIGSNKENKIQIINNIFNLAVDKIDIGSIIWGALEGANKASFISENFISEEDFIRLINNTVKTNNLKEVVNDIVKFFFESNNDINNTSFVNITKEYLKDEQRKTKFKEKIQKIFENALSSNNLREPIKKIINKAMNYLEVKADEPINTFIENFTNGLGDFFKRIEINSKLIDATTEAFEESENLGQLSQKIKDKMIAKVNPTSFGLVSKILNDSLMQENKEGLKSLVKQLLTNFLNNEEKIRKTINDINLSALITGRNDEELNKLINNTIITFIKNPDLRDLLTLILDNIIDNAKKYENKTTWLEAVNVLLHSNNAEQMKQKFKNWFKASVSQNGNIDFIKGITKLAIIKFKESGFNLNQNRDEVVIEHIIQKTLAWISNDTLFNTIIDKIYDNLRNLDFTKATPQQVKQKIMDGALSFILTDDMNSISFKKILNQASKIRLLTRSFNESIYVEFINRLFESSDLERTTGIYSVLDFLFKDKPSSGSSNETNTNNNQNNDQPKTYGFSFDENIFNVVGRTEELIKAIFEPIFKSMFTKISQNNYNLTQSKNNPEYKAIFRLTSIMLWAIFEKGATGGKFWNFTGLDVEGTFVGGLEKAWESAKNAKANLWNKFSDDQKIKSGAYKKSWWSGGGFAYNREFITGNRSDRTSLGNYWNDQLLAYIYWNKDNDRHNQGYKNKETLRKAIKQGWLSSSN